MIGETLKSSGNIINKQQPTKKLPLNHGDAIKITSTKQLATKHETQERNWEHKNNWNVGKVFTEVLDKHFPWTNKY